MQMEQRDGPESRMKTMRTIAKKCSDNALMGFLPLQMLHRDFVKTTIPGFEPFPAFRVLNLKTGLFLKVSDSARG